MYVVPLEGDIIVTKDDITMNVIGYNNYKTKGPAVFVDSKFGRTMTVYFFDIEKINGVRVDYQLSSKIFFANGIIKRKIHLPQINEKILVTGKIDDIDDGWKIVNGYKLHNKQLGLGTGLNIKVQEDIYFRLKDILDIERSIRDSRFDKKRFQKIYSDYIGY